MVAGQATAFPGRKGRCRMAPRREPIPVPPLPLRGAALGDAEEEEAVAEGGGQGGAAPDGVGGVDGPDQEEPRPRAAGGRQPTDGREAFHRMDYPRCEIQRGGSRSGAAVAGEGRRTTAGGTRPGGKKTSTTRRLLAVGG